MLILPIKEKERSENDEIDAPEIDLRISRDQREKCQCQTGRKEARFVLSSQLRQSLQLLKNNQAIKPESFLSRFLVLKLVYKFSNSTSFVI